MKHNFFGEVINANACLRLANDICTDFNNVRLYQESASKFIKKNKLTLNDFRTLEEVLMDHWINGNSCTFNKSVADIFKKYKFNISMDKRNVNYLIS